MARRSNCCGRGPGHFDSSFPETGPPPVLTDAGIVVLYNGKNASGEGGVYGDPELGANAYAAGEALFDAKDPAHLLAQTGRSGAEAGDAV